MTVVAIVAAVLSNSPLAPYAALSCVSFLLLGLGRLAITAIIGFGILLPAVMIVATPIVVVWAILSREPFTRAVSSAYKRVYQGFLSFFDQMGGQLPP